MGYMQYTRVQILRDDKWISINEPIFLADDGRYDIIPFIYEGYHVYEFLFKAGRHKDKSEFTEKALLKEPNGYPSDFTHQHEIDDIFLDGEVGQKGWLPFIDLLTFDYDKMERNIVLEYDFISEKNIDFYNDLSACPMVISSYRNYLSKSSYFPNIEIIKSLGDPFKTRLILFKTY